MSITIAEDERIPGPVTFEDLEGVRIYTADCRDAMRTMEADSIDTIITDGPYGLGFMGKEWDTFNPGFNAEKTESNKSGRNGREIRRPANEAGRYNRSRNANFGFQVAMTEFFTDALRVAKPGAMLFAFGGTRTFHRLTCAIEDAGWEIRDTMGWIHGQGFPKSHNLAGAIDRKLGHGDRGHRIAAASRHHPDGTLEPNGEELPAYEARSEEAQPWTGYGTALKPAWEPICVAMKPLDGTFADNALKWGVAGLNVNGGRIDTGEPIPSHLGTNGADGRTYGARSEYIPGAAGKEFQSLGRWPANILHDGSEEALSVFPEVGDSRQGFPRGASSGDGLGMTRTGAEYSDAGSASRFFYCAKSSTEERNEGLTGPDRTVNRSNGAKAAEARGESLDRSTQSNGLSSTYRRKNNHPTVKPLSLMRYLVRLSKMPQRPGYRQKVLDLFAGSGTTGVACIWEGVDAVLIEKEPDHVEIIKGRCAHAIRTKAIQPELFTAEAHAKTQEPGILQGNLF